MKYDANLTALIWLNSFDCISPLKRSRILSLADNPADIYKNLKHFKEGITELTDSVSYDRLSNALDKAYLDMLIAEIEKYGIIPVGITSEEYPVWLKEIDMPPVLLYCRGDVTLLNHQRLIGVVGTRLPTRYGRDVTELFVNGLLDNGFCIVSGLARGIDTAAHEITLSRCGPQIAVLGCGLDTVYPAENRGLLQKIAETGLAITEYRVGEKPLAYHFPERNRIISGLSRGVLVTEAGENSGSLITADYAEKQCRGVYVVPGNIFSKQSMGANERIKRNPAILVTSPDDILLDLNLAVLKEPEAEKEKLQLDMTETAILNALEDREMHIEELIALTGLEVNKLGAVLTKMELMGLIKKLHGNNYGV